jgi:16S rRNA (guanine(966)-N(2))-methyltransferase RsmD
MRIISGKFKGRRFSPPADKWPTRPTTDIAKEGLFNMLGNLLDYEETKFLDLFGGTGSHSYEFISRGCTSVTYVDKFSPCVQFVKGMAKQLDIETHIRIERDDIFRFIPRCTEKFSYIFAGPPYALPTLDDIPDLIFKYPILMEDGFFVLEHNPNHKFKDHPRFWQKRNYGETQFSFFR